MTDHEAIAERAEKARRRWMSSDVRDSLHDIPELLAEIKRLETSYNDLAYEHTAAMLERNASRDEIKRLEGENEKRALQQRFTEQQRDELASMVNRLREALERIRREGGEVCEDYELCTHRACQSSYTVWAIASQALEQPVREEERTS